MLEIYYTKRLLKDLKLVKKRGKVIKKIELVMDKLASGESLEKKYLDHGLIGNYANRRECHIESDWLLIYKLEKQVIVFERTGTHSDLFQ